MADNWVYLTSRQLGYGYYANTNTHIGGIASVKADLRRALDDPAVSFEIPGLDEDIGERVTAQELSDLSVTVQELLLRDKSLSTHAVPLTTQDNASSDPGSLEDDHEREALVEAFPDSISMSYALKNKHEELYMYEKRRGMNPYDLANVKKANVDAVPEGANKAKDTMVFNLTVALFKQAREDAGLRNFLAEIFTSLNHYTDDKPKVNKLKEEVAMLSKLHAEKQEVTTLANLRASQKLRAASVKAKGEAQAEKKLPASDAEMAKKANNLGRLSMLRPAAGDGPWATDAEVLQNIAKALGSTVEDIAKELAVARGPLVNMTREPRERWCERDQLARPYYGARDTNSRVQSAIVDWLALYAAATSMSDLGMPVGRECNIDYRDPPASWQEASQRMAAVVKVARRTKIARANAMSMPSSAGH